MTTPDTISRALDRVLPFVQKPARYTGGEFNSVVKDWDATPYRLALVFPDVYDLGMSNLGVAILYDGVNAQPDMLAERAYTPWVDMQAAMREAGIPLYGLESRHPLADFDVLGFSLPYEQLYTNVLATLDLAGIPLHATDRIERPLRFRQTSKVSADWPLILAGGSACLNPEPMHTFFDAFFIGEGENAITEIVRAWTDARRAGLSRTDALAALARIEGVYVPSHYEVSYNEDGTIAGSRVTEHEHEIAEHPVGRFSSASSPPSPLPRPNSSCPSSTSSIIGRLSRSSAVARAAAVFARRAWCSGRCASGLWTRCSPRWTR